MSLFSIVARMRFDSSEVDAGLKRTESAFAGLAGRLAPMFSGAAIFGFLKAGADAADNIKDMAQQLEISDTRLVQLKVSAKAVAADISDVATSLKTVNALRATLAEGGKPADEAAKTFRTLGIDPRIARDKGVSTDLLLQMIAEQARGVKPTYDIEAARAQAMGRPFRRTLATYQGVKPSMLTQQEINSAAEVGQLLETLGIVSKEIAPTKLLGRIMMEADRLELSRINREGLSGPMRLYPEYTGARQRRMEYYAENPEGITNKVALDQLAELRKIAAAVSQSPTNSAGLFPP